MKIRYDPDFIEGLKKADVRIRKSFKKRLVLFEKNPHSPQLNNHALRDEWRGYRSIDITADWRAIYKELITIEGDEVIVYFTTFGTHAQLYR